MNKEDLIKKAMSELGKRSAKKNKRDYSAMGKKGAEKRWVKKLEESLICEKCGHFVSMHGDNDICYSCKAISSKC